MQWTMASLSGDLAPSRHAVAAGIAAFMHGGFQAWQRAWRSNVAAPHLAAMLCAFCRVLGVLQILVPPHAWVRFSLGVGMAKRAH